MTRRSTTSFVASARKKVATRRMMTAHLIGNLKAIVREKQAKLINLSP